MSDRYKGAILSPTAPTVTPQSAGGIYTSSQQLQYQGQGVWPTAFNNPVNNSLRFRASASAYLNRTPASAGNQKTWTFSFWVKRGILSSFQYLYGVGGGSNDSTIAFYSDDSLAMYLNDGAGATGLRTTQVFRDPSAWYHVIIAMDTTQATASNRMKMYINGSQVTAFQVASYPNQNTDWQVNTNAYAATIGRGRGGSYSDCYMAEYNFIDGVQLTPSSFGTTDAYGIWQPIPYTGAYGTNGFYLPFTDNSALTTTTNVGLGKDFSGNGNYWTTNNISITAGSTYDSMTDVPTNTNSNTANYAVMNPLNKASLVTVTDGNLTLSPSSASWGAISGTVAVTSGKWYYEYSASISSALTMCGWATTDEDVNTTYGSAVTKQWVMYLANGNKYGNGSNAVSYASSVSANTVVGVALDMDAGTLTFYIGGVSQGTAFSTGLSGKTLVPWIPVNSGAGAFSGYANFGQRPFSYTPPSGFYPLNTYNLPTPTILAGNQYMDAALYTGTGSSQTISSLNFSPDFVWIKERSADRNHRLQDSVRGANKSLRSNGTQAEATDSADGYVSAFTSNGFTTAAGSSSILDVGESSGTYVAWCWDANGSGSSNTNGSITSTVSVNTTAGFSVVTYTTPASGAFTVGHGLGVAPSFIINRIRTIANNWYCYHVSLGNNTEIVLNTTAAAVSAAGDWNSTSPTSTVFSMGTGWAGSYSMVSYCWAAVAGYSAFGSYTGNGSTDGPFIYTGFRPRFVIVKNTVDPNNWVTFDSARNTYNIVVSQLYPNASDAEATGSSTNGIDFLSNGFKIRSSFNWGNRNGDTIIYMAFAENPFKIARGR